MFIGLGEHHNIFEKSSFESLLAPDGAPLNLIDNPLCSHLSQCRLGLKTESSENEKLNPKEASLELEGSGLTRPP